MLPAQNVDGYIALVRTTGFKVLTIVLFAGLLIAAAYGAFVLAELGLKQEDVTPEGSQEKVVLNVRDEYFSFYPFDIATAEADYSSVDVQKGIPKLWDAVMATEHVLPGAIVWQQAFLKWGLPSTPQYTNKDDVCNSANLLTGGNCGQDHDCAVTLDAETKEAYYPPEKYYRCLEAWLNIDTAAALISPGVELVDYSASTNKDMQTPGWRTRGHRLKFVGDGTVDKAESHLAYARGSLNAYGLNTNDDYIELIDQVRGVTDAFEKDDSSQLKSFPNGIPFTYWEQYVGLYDVILTAVGFSLLCAFVASLVLLTVMPVGKASIFKKVGVAFWGAVFITVTIAMIVFEVFGFCGITKIKISAIPAVSLIMCVGVGVEFTAHIVLSYMNATGTRAERVDAALAHMFTPTFDGAVSTLLGVCMMGFSDFEFIIKYFFHLYFVIVVFGVLNGLVLLPVMLAIVGPPSASSDPMDTQLTGPTAPGDGQHLAVMGPEGSKHDDDCL